MGVLSEILESKRRELPELRRKKLPQPPSERPVVALTRGAASPSNLRLICEIKLKSPSAGPLSRALSVAQRAQTYEECGAWMISVLCDGPFFDGSYEHLSEARSATHLPLLCKEFVIDECQLDAAASYGASAVLLIVRCLDQARLSALIEAASKRGLTPLVEVFTEEEAKRAVDCGAQFVGVNSRDLDTLEIDSDRAARIVRSFGEEIFVAQLSGVRSPAEVAQVAASRADAALIGEVLMRQDDPRALLRALVDAPRIG